MGGWVGWRGRWGEGQAERQEQGSHSSFCPSCLDEGVLGGGGTPAVGGAAAPPPPPPSTHLQQQRMPAEELPMPGSSPAAALMATNVHAGPPVPAGRLGLPSRTCRLAIRRTKFNNYVSACRCLRCLLLLLGRVRHGRQVFAREIWMIGVIR